MLSEVDEAPAHATTQWLPPLQIPEAQSDARGPVTVLNDDWAEYEKGHGYVLDPPSPAAGWCFLSAAAYQQGSVLLEECYKVASTLVMKRLTKCKALFEERWEARLEEDERGHSLVFDPPSRGLN